MCATYSGSIAVRRHWHTDSIIVLQIGEFSVKSIECNDSKQVAPDSVKGAAVISSPVLFLLVFFIQVSVAIQPNSNYSWKHFYIYK